MRRSNQIPLFCFSLLISLFLFQGCTSFKSMEGKQVAHPPVSGAVGQGCEEPNTEVIGYYGVIDNEKKTDPELVEILTQFPKGADIHNHLSGAVRPEFYITLGSAAGDCFGPVSAGSSMYTVAALTSTDLCPDGFKPMAQASDEERQQLIRSFSMYQFNDTGTPSIQAGHDQFFATFGRFGAISGSPGNIGPMLVNLRQQAHADSVSYVETMASFQSGEVSRLTNLLGQRCVFADFANPNKYPDMLQYLLDQGLANAVGAAQNDIAAYVNRTDALLGCDDPAKAEPACDVAFDFQAAVNRNSSLPDGSANLAKIFTQTALSFLLAHNERRVVGVNLVSGEDLAVSMGTFSTQMAFYRFFHQQYPDVNIALHGGELTPCFVGEGNSALQEHITGSIQAGAKRVGHAVSFFYLSDTEKAEVVELMRQNDTLVEIPLASNAQILGVAGDGHPFPEYFRQYEIPAVFATDDEGVSYADFTDEWIYAGKQYSLTPEELVLLARSSLQYSFLPGDPLWQNLKSNEVVHQCAGEILGSDHPDEPCRSFIGSSAKAGMQWHYEAELAQFNREYGSRLAEYFGGHTLTGQ